MQPFAQTSVHTSLNYNYYMIYHSMIGVIHKGLCNHPRTLTFDLPLLLKLDSALTRENSTDALGIRLPFNYDHFRLITITKNKFSEIHIPTPTP